MTDTKTVNEPTTESGGMSPGVRKGLKILVFLVVALVWVRLVLFAWLFPIIERKFDNPEFTDDTPAAVETDPVETEPVSFGGLPAMTPGVRG